MGRWYNTKRGHRPVNAWGDGDLPAPYAEGDILDVPDGPPLSAALSGRHDGGPGEFTVSAVFSIAEGDAWYIRLERHGRGQPRYISDRLHIVHADRCCPADNLESSIDYTAGMSLVSTSDPEGLARRQEMLEAGWTPPCRADEDMVPFAFVEAAWDLLVNIQNGPSDWVQIKRGFAEQLRIAEQGLPHHLRVRLRHGDVPDDED